MPQFKITKYLLNPDHEKGAAKAAYFARFGFLADQWEALADGSARPPGPQSSGGRDPKPLGDEVRGPMQR
ncbi:DUF6883 domain-containing protein [Methylobacterium sp. J-090]|uniref:DUF6883 domain-containing protein n=1 Tax=Methylobacterium sp. J-090 TaxID=2836666 RepID=UPI001FBAC0CA|nr:DUF6883 domain-containing protein [Methylobacterium sp. J-090]MCJ2083304.1 hypothetical protein [Methylobacterium sp. J-090]